MRYIHSTGMNEVPYDYALLQSLRGFHVMAENWTPESVVAVPG
jgi:hypothetical protein